MRSPITAPPLDEREYFPLSAHIKLRREPYKGGVSSRTTPVEYPSVPPGTWLLDDTFAGPYGRSIEELVEFHPRDLTPTEFDWENPKEQLRYEGKWNDALRYAEWLAQGREPPPIEVVATNGHLRVTEGHRRLAAADMVGVPIKAWVSWSVPQPEGLCDVHSGAPIPVGLTYELAHGLRAANGDDDNFVEGEAVAYGPLSGGAYTYRLGHVAESTGAPYRGRLRVRLEDGMVVDLDSDTFTPLRRLLPDPDAVDRISEEASRSLRDQLQSRVPNPEEPPVMRGAMMQPEFDPAGWWMSEKLDGVRGWWDGQRIMSRRGNVFAAPEWFTDGWPTDLVMDGELFGGRGNFNETSGTVRRLKPHAGWKKLVYFVFDLPTHRGTYEERMDALDELVGKIDSPYLAAVPRMQVADKDQLQLVLEKIEQSGGEGLVIVAPESRYVPDKTRNVLKVKRFHDAEASVYGYAPGKGRHEGSVGALLVRDGDGREFKVGSGLTDIQRRRARQLFPPGTLVTYRYFETTPAGKPRFPTFVRVRAEEPTGDIADLRARLL